MKTRNLLIAWKKNSADFPNQCYVTDKGYTVGKHFPPGICEEIDCHSDFSYDVYGYVH